MHLPSATEPYMLHQPPMRLVKELLCVKGDYAEARTILNPGDVGIGPDGRVEETVLMEMVAQAYAAAQGYRDQEKNKPPGLGYLVGVGDFQIIDVPEAGRSLRITVKSTRSFEDFYLVEGQVLDGSCVLVHGTLKTWVQPDQADENP